LPTLGPYHCIHQATKGCYHSVTVYKGSFVLVIVVYLSSCKAFLKNTCTLRVVGSVSGLTSHLIVFQEATELGKKARDLKKAADALHQEERSGAKGRKWRKNVKAVEKVHHHI